MVYFQTSDSQASCTRNQNRLGSMVKVRLPPLCVCRGGRWPGHHTSVRKLRSHRTGNKNLNRTDVQQSAAVWALQPTGLDPLPRSTDSIKVKSGKLIRQVDEVFTHLYDAIVVFIVLLH